MCFHGLFNHGKKSWQKGEKPLKLHQLGSHAKALIRYKPVLHIDVYGTIGEVFGNSSYRAMADYLKTLEEAVLIICASRGRWIRAWRSADEGFPPTALLDQEGHRCRTGGG